MRSNLFDSSTVNTSDCVEKKLNMITKTASPHLCSSTRGEGGGGVRQQLWFPSISFLGGLPGQMGQPDVTCVKRECLYLTVSPLCLALANPHKFRPALENMSDVWTGMRRATSHWQSTSATSSTWRQWEEQRPRVSSPLAFTVITLRAIFTTVKQHASAETRSRRIPGRIHGFSGR